MQRRGILRAAVTGVGLLVAATGCRDAPELFEPPENPPLGPAPYRLTFSPDRDGRPDWSPDGDTIYYLREPAEPEADPGQGGSSAVLKIPAAGGTAARAVPVLQPPTGGGSAFELVTVSAERIAVFTSRPLDGAICGAAVAVCGSVVAPPPRLSGGEIRVRGIGSTESPETDPRLTVDYPGRAFDTSDPPEGLEGVHVIELRPFQVLFNETGRRPTGISWSPEGDRVVFSDGIGLVIWNPTTGAVSRIPNGDGGIDPAWSPRGDWIAFQRLESGAASTTECRHFQLGDLQCVERRTEYAFPRASLAVIRPDGSDLRLLPEGSAPAFSADGLWIYYEGIGGIWSVDIGGRGAAPVPGAEGGVEPALSSDGSRLAFSRTDPDAGGTDLWIVDVSPE